MWSAIGVLLVLSGVCLIVVPTTSKMPALVFLVFTAMSASMGIVGALIVTRQTRNAVGWILWVGAVATFVSDITSVYANFAVTPDGAALPGATFVAWLAPIGFFPSFIAILIFVPLLFPDGRYLSRRWRWVGAFGAAVVGLVLAGILFTPGPLPEYPAIVNPVGLAPIGFFPSFIAILIFVPLLFPDGRYLGRRWRWVGAFGAAVVGLILAGIMFTPGPLAEYPAIVNPVGLAPIDALRPLLAAASTWGFVIVAPLAIASAVVRYRRGSTLERTQLRWFGAAAGLTVAVLVMAFALGLQGEAAALAWLGGILGVTLIPIAIGVAILRYRLYELDRLVSRTIGWAVVTAVLVGVFATLVVSLQTVFAQLANESSLAVAASTLVAFALFQPVRRRVQRVVDRRFDRARYDGEKTTQAFARLVREQVEIDALARDLRAAVDGSMSPDGLTLWLRTVHPSPIPTRP